MISVEANLGVSINDLCALQREGFSVARSSHIGNHFLSNSILLAAGLPAMLFDRNQFQKDHNNHPGYLIQGGQMMPLGHEAGLVPFGASACQLHLGALRTLFGPLIRTEAEYFSSHLEVVEKIFRLMEAKMPQTFDRYLYGCGEVGKFYFSTDSFINHCDGCGRTAVDKNKLAESALQLLQDIWLAEQGEQPACRTGVMWSLPLQLVLESVLQVMDSGRDQVYQLSGPDMIRYIKNRVWLEQVSWVWGVLQRHAPAWGLEVPAAITVHIVPTADVRFGYMAGHEPGRVVVEGLLELERLKADRQNLRRQEVMAGVFGRAW